jgi:hypothetical protein
LGSTLLHFISTGNFFQFTSLSTLATLQKKCKEDFNLTNFFSSKLREETNQRRMKIAEENTKYNIPVPVKPDEGS